MLKLFQYFDVQYGRHLQDECEAEWGSGSTCRSRSRSKPKGVAVQWGEALELRRRVGGKEVRSDFTQFVSLFVFRDEIMRMFDYFDGFPSLPQGPYSFDTITLHSPKLTSIARPIYSSTSSFRLTISLKTATVVWDETLEQLHHTTRPIPKSRTNTLHTARENLWTRIIP
jgi:hypothetical protein